MKQNKKLIAFALAAFFAAALCFSQDAAQDQGDEELLQETAEPEVNPELQKNFIIVEPARIHELNPQITSYASDSQILTGLYEGLFSYNPLTL